VIFKEISTNHFTGSKARHTAHSFFYFAEVLGGAGVDLFPSVRKVMPLNVTIALEVCFCCRMEKFVITYVTYPLFLNCHESERAKV
jgi:hypothetical protein